MIENFKNRTEISYKVEPNIPTPSLDFNMYIKEWLDLQKHMMMDYDYTTVDGAIRNKYGNIISIKDDECFTEVGLSKNEDCTKRKSKNGPCILRKGHKNHNDLCAEERHIKGLNISRDPSKPNNFISSDKTDYTIMDSVKIVNNSQFNAKISNTRKRIDDNIEMFYRIFKSGVSKNIYILFSSGLVIDVRIFANELYDLLEKINLYSDYNRIVIGGHSMGCMIALQFANIIYKDNKHFFEDKCAVLGSGPYKGYFYDDPLPNTKIFVSGVTFPPFEKAETKIAIDGYLYKSVDSDNRDEKHYSPVIVLNKTFKDDDDDDGKEFNYSLLQTVKGLKFVNNNSVLESLHDFTQNYDIFFKNFKTDFNTVNGDLDVSISIIDKLKNENLLSESLNSTPIKNGGKKRSLKHRKKIQRKTRRYQKLKDQ